MGDERIEMKEGWEMNKGRLAVGNFEPISQKLNRMQLQAWQLAGGSWQQLSSKDGPCLRQMANADVSSILD